MSGPVNNQPDLERGLDHNSQTFPSFPLEILRPGPPAVPNPDPGAYCVQRG